MRNLSGSEIDKDFSFNFIMIGITVVKKLILLQEKELNNYFKVLMVKRL